MKVYAENRPEKQGDGKVNRHILTASSFESS
jgi:hypothetical protein